MTNKLEDFLAIVFELSEFNQSFSGNSAKSDPIFCSNLSSTLFGLYRDSFFDLSYSFSQEFLNSYFLYLRKLKNYDQ